ncbi:MAG TPA: protein kinase family protein [Puia sp.]|jgi:serine/threonine protein kinase|nr:protein kinase family protein [Puia sp.]
MSKLKYDGTIELDRDFNNNYIQIDDGDFMLDYLNGRPSKGSSANVFALIDPDEEFTERVIKICKSSLEGGRNRRIDRFNREIKALKLAKNNSISGIIELIASGILELEGRFFPYIVMEKADEDLGSYLESNHFNFTISQKLTLCITILNAIKQLHSLKIYHRDIKQDNILRVGKEFKIGDLGLIKFQNEDFDIDNRNEKIGPFGWHSPEATNKMLTFKKRIGYEYDCDINYKSDIFQLGKLFWYIFQGNLPIGQLQKDDYRFEADIYEVFHLMLQYDKKRRPDLEQLEGLFKPLLLKYAV